MYAANREGVERIKAAYRQDTDNGSSLTLVETSNMKLMLFSQTEIKPIIAPITTVTYRRRRRGIDANGVELIDLPIKLIGKIYINGEAIDIIPGARQNTSGNAMRNRTQATNQLLSDAKENFKKEAVRIFMEKLNQARNNKNISKINPDAKEKVSDNAC